MRRDPRSSLLWALAIIVIGGYLSGCGEEGGNLPPIRGTARIQGIVVDAVNPAQRIAGATIRAGQAEQVSDASGAFAFTRLNQGTVQLAVSFQPGAGYRAAQLNVPTVSGKVTQVIVAAVPEAVNSPDNVSLDPTSGQVEVGGQVQFTATVTALGLPSPCTPSFALTGGVGAITAAGLFTATAQGTGVVTASAGAASATATITVVAVTGPRLGTLSVSPSSLPAEGGQVRIALTATSVAGIIAVTAAIEHPDGLTENVALRLGTGTHTDGTWVKARSVPANSNPTDSEGHQLPQTYNVQVTARDGQNRLATSASVSFTVVGLEPPPPPPGA